LRTCFTLEELKSDLETLPKTLEETYDRILLRIEDRHRHNAFKILQWLAFAARPVTVKEAAEVLAIDLRREPCYNPNLKLFDPQDVMILCSSLITRATSSIDAEPGGSATYSEYYEVNYEYEGLGSKIEDFEVIRLAHLSVRDYLISDRIKTSEARSFAINVRLANIFMAKTCIVYLLHSAFALGYCNEAVLRRCIKEWPLYHYATHFWPFHVRASGDILDDGIWQLLGLFFDTKKTAKGGNFATWVVALTPDIPLEAVQRTQPLYYAASFGITSLIRKLLESDADIDIEAPGGRFASPPLQVAAYRNHPTAVELLLEVGADPMALNGQGDSCLHWAILRGHMEVQRLLRSYGATLTLQDVHNLKWYQAVYTDEY
jgi:hypothetical protein